MTSPIKAAALRFIIGITGTPGFLKQFVIEDPSYALNYGALVLKDGIPLMPGVPNMIFPVEKDEYVFLASQVVVDSFTDDEIAILQCYALYMTAVVKEQELVLVTDNLILRTTKRMLASIKADKALAKVFGPRTILDLWLKSIDLSVNSQVLRDQTFIEIGSRINDSNKDLVRKHCLSFAKPKLDALYGMVATDPARKSDTESAPAEAINHAETNCSIREIAIKYIASITGTPSFLRTQIRVGDADFTINVGSTVTKVPKRISICEHIELPGDNIVVFTVSDLLHRKLNEDEMAILQCHTLIFTRSLVPLANTGKTYGDVIKSAIDNADAKITLLFGKEIASKFLLRLAEIICESDELAFHFQETNCIPFDKENKSMVVHEIKSKVALRLLALK
jgi:hypothetical protein